MFAYNVLESFSCDKKYIYNLRLTYYNFFENE